MIKNKTFFLLSACSVPLLLFACIMWGAESVEVGAKYGLHLIRQAGVGEAPVTVYVPLHNPYS